jgi:iron-sulfur cluster assembly protein
MKQIITLSDSAAKRVQELLAARTTPPLGLRIGVKTKGCNGLAYTIEYTDEQHPGDEMLIDKGVKIFIEPKAVMFVIGTEMDFVEEDLQSGFTFRNPNEKGRCGCGESFHV